MKINFTKKQYEDLIKLLHLGNWMINAHRTDDYVEQYEDLEQYILSFYKDFGMEKHVEYDKEFNEYFPTRDFEEDTDVCQYKEEYDDCTFWDELIDRLARRDLIKEYGEAAVLSMTMEEIIEKEQPFIQIYEDEFEMYGVDNLEITDRNMPLFLDLQGNA